MSVISVYAIFASTGEAERIGRTVIEERLAACINIFAPVRSIYRWEDSLETADEATAIFKTGEERVEALMARIAALHSYEVPCIAAWPVDRVLARYARWVEDSTG